MTERKLPPGWAWTTLGDACPPKYGKALPKEQRDAAAHFPVVGSAGVMTRTDAALVVGPCLVIGRKGNIGQVQAFETPCWPIDTTFFVQPPSFLDQKFLAHTLNAVDFGALNRSTTTPSLRREELENIPVPLPPLPEQHRIVEALEDHLSRLDAADANLVKAQARAGSLRRMRPDPASPEFGFPRRALKSLLREPLRNGHSGRVTHSGRGIRAVTLSAVTNNEFSERYTKLTDTPESKAESLWLLDGDIFVQRSNTPDLVGSSALYRGANDWAIFPDLLIRVRPDEQEVLPEYLAEVLRSESVKSYFRRSARGLSGSMPKISQSTIEEVVVPLPTIERQQQWVDESSGSASSSARLSRSIAAAKARSSALRRSLLRAAFNGDLVDQDPTDEPADVGLAKLHDQQSGTAPRRGRKALATLDR